MSERAVDEALFEQLSRIGRAVASAKRIELLDVLSQGERCVDALAKAVNMPINNTSNHLKVLRHANLVSTRRHGTQIFYSTDRHVTALLRELWTVADGRLSEMAQLLVRHLPNDHARHRTTAAQLYRRLQRGDVVVIDVRPAQEYDATHIPGAHSVPFSLLTLDPTSVPATGDVVVYCRGPHSVLAARAAQILREYGYRAHALDVGLPDWRDAGLPVTTPQPSPNNPPHPQVSHARNDTSR